MMTDHSQLAEVRADHLSRTALHQRSWRRAGRCVKGCRVLMLDADLRPSLAACRSLGRSGHEVGVCITTGDPFASYSRYAIRTHALPDPRGEASAYHTAIESIVREHAYDVILAVHDWTLARLGSLEQQLSVPCFPFVGRSVDLLTDKVGLADLCAATGTAYPATVELAPDVDWTAAMAAVGGLPVVIKGARSSQANQDRIAFQQGATVATSIAQAKSNADFLREQGLVPIMQARIDAVEKVNAAIIRRAGHTELRYAHRVLREVPSTGGVGIALQTIDPEAGVGGEAVSILERVCAAADHVGIAQAELYRARGDRRLYLLDVNPRLWGSTWFAERLGLRVLDRGIRLALDLPAPPYPAKYAAGRRFHYPPGEWRWLRDHNHLGHALWNIARTTRPWDVFEADLVSDPIPLLHKALAKAR